MKYLLVATLLALSGNAWACSCWGTVSIERTIATHPLLIEGQVTSAGREGATLRVTRVLKGSVSSNTIDIENSLCYQSLDTEMMEPGHTYILPLPERADGLYAPMEPSNGRHVMPGCAESGLELVNGKLYTFEQTIGVQRRPRLYGDYSHFVRWRPLAEVTAIFGLFVLSSLGLALKGVGPVGALVLLGVCVALPVVFVRSPAELRRKLMVLILALPSLWILIGLWGAVFRSDVSSEDEPFRYTDWHSYPPLIGVVFLFSFAAVWIKRAPASWAFSVPYSLLNGYFAAVMCLLAEAAMTGALI